MGGDDRSATWQVRLTNEALLGIRVLKYALAPGGCTAFRSHSNSNMMTHPARGQVAHSNDDQDDSDDDLFELDTATQARRHAKKKQGKK